MTVWADKFNGDTSVVSRNIKEIPPPFDLSKDSTDDAEMDHMEEEISNEEGMEIFPDMVYNMLDGDISNDSFYKILKDKGASVSRFPTDTTFFDQDTFNKNKFLITTSGNKQENETCSFFVILGRMLMQRFTFISEKRSFIESNDFEKQSLRNDGSNLQSFLFWLQHGNREEQASFFSIQHAFNKIVGNENLSFNVSVVENIERHDLQASEQSANACQHRITVQFAESLGQRQKYTDFISIGVGIQETLFLLAKCFERRDRVILMDEPATNLHPTMIRKLMDEIFTSNNQEQFGQIAVITHSPSVTSLEMLSSMNKIVRIDRTQYSTIVQPSKRDSDWIANRLPTFHLFNPEILFSKQIALVEGPSDKFFLDVLLKYYGTSRTGDNVLTLDVGGIGSFPKFGKLLDIFHIPYIILGR